MAEKEEGDKKAEMRNQETCSEMIHNKPAVAVDIDGCLISWGDGWKGIEVFGEPFDGAKAFLEKLRTKYYVIIHTCRCNQELNDMEPETLAGIVEVGLRELGLPFDEVWAKPGKPIAVRYIDDRGAFCDPEVDPDSYDRILKDLGLIDEG